ncbi:MAG: MBL fold metallo-hydrolase [Vibrio sp.]
MLHKPYNTDGIEKNNHDFCATVIGCGDAYDSTHTNASLIVSESGFNLLIDCGPSVPRALFQRQIDADYLDAIYVTHTHPDHCLGLTTLLNWMDSKERQRPLTIIVSNNQKSVLLPLIEFAHWPQPNLVFEIQWQFSDTIESIGPWPCQTTITRHAVNNHSLSLTSQSGITLFYSGDGLLLPQGEALAANAHWVFVECETLSHHPSHGSWEDIHGLKRRLGSEWRLYHIDPIHRSELATLCCNHQGMSLAEDNEQLRANATKLRKVSNE